MISISCWIWRWWVGIDVPGTRPEAPQTKGFDNDAASDGMGDAQTGLDGLGDTQEELGKLPDDPIPDDRTGMAKAARWPGFIAGAISSLFDFRGGYQDKKSEGGSTSDAIFAGTAAVVKTVDDIAVSTAGGLAGSVRGGASGAKAGAATGIPHGAAIGTGVGTVAGGVAGGYLADKAYDNSLPDRTLDAAIDAKFDRISENFNSGYDESRKK